MAKAAKKAKLSAGETLSEANNEFAADIYQALLPGQSSGNFVLSPYSLHSVLGMVSQGAQGETKAELIKGLKFKEEETDKTIRSSYKYIISDLTEKGGYLRTANRIFSKTDFTLNKSFVKILQKDFLAGVEQLDFSSGRNRSKAAGKINRWVATQTNNKITNLVDPDSLDAETSLLLVNCIHFKGTWEVKFKPYMTDNNAKFHVTPTEKVKVALMNETSSGFAYGELPELDAHVVELDYKEGEMAMRIILPKAVDGLAKIQAALGTLRQNGRNLVAEAIDKFGEENEDYEVNLELPKFKIEATIGNLKRVLRENLGMNSMFSEKTADFGGIPDGVNDPPLHVSEVIQKAYISVNELGTEAAAATKVQMLRRSAPGCNEPRIVDFCVDRPFYFEIVDGENDDLVLFSGHVIDPSQ